MSPACRTAELIPGYTLRERIGAGGYGEVWKADAPGGLLKAIKLVYGCLNEERAARELKALSRIREVRHPFLLSLERIEVVDGQLVVITELADASLRDRFDQCLAEGREGIPHEELLPYLRDAADALDYMAERFSLQHLDVKPENLLLVGGRVKVGDFGLVKDMQDASVSLMGGLTPVYAAPEVFDGHPSLHSDQYALAIVYQEMLTGALPFPGRTPAQLATQHLHSNPRLTPVPPADRPILARALSKDPGQRFPDCRTLVNALLERAAADRGARTAGEAGPAHGIAGAETTSAAAAFHNTVQPRDLEPADKSRSPGRTSSVRTISLEAENVPVIPALDGIRENTRKETTDLKAEWSADWPLPLATFAPTVEELPPVKAAAAEAGLRPVLVLGVGGTAARTLAQLRRRWSARFGDPAAVPSLQMLLVDTDPQTIAEAVSADRAEALDSGQTLLASLRTPKDYGEAWEDHKRWLSRRFLCNLPRSQRTEGLRPVGRLALVDHVDELRARIRTAIAEVSAPEALAASAEHAQMPVRSTAPSVILIASTSGGAGSGMALELAYVVRTVLTELSLPETSLCGVLVHSTPRHSSERMLAALSSCACLRELRRYSGAKGYPGEFLCDLPAFAPGVAPFDDTYVVDLGDKLNDYDFHQATGGLAEYLHVATATPAGALLERCRAAGRAAKRPAAEATVRSFGICRLPGAGDSPAAPAEPRNCWERAEPRMEACGARRTFVMCPAQPAGGVICDGLPDGLGTPSVVVDPRSEPVLWYEIEGVPLARVAARLIENRPDYAKLAGRLLSRVDVAW